MDLASLKVGITHCLDARWKKQEIINDQDFPADELSRKVGIRKSLNLEFIVYETEKGFAPTFRVRFLKVCKISL